MNLWKTSWKGSKFCKHRPNFLLAGYPTLFTPGLGVGYECPLISFNYASESDLNEFSLNMSMSNETQYWCKSNRNSKIRSVKISSRVTHNVLLKVFATLIKDLFLIILNTYRIEFKYCFQKFLYTKHHFSYLKFCWIIVEHWKPQQIVEHQAFDIKRKVGHVQ